MRDAGFIQSTTLIIAIGLTRLPAVAGTWYCDDDDLDDSVILKQNFGS